MHTHFRIAMLIALGALAPGALGAQWSTTYEQFYLQAPHNWEFRERYVAADRLFNAFDYGHHGGALLLWTEPDAPPSEPAWSVPLAVDFTFRVLDPASPSSVARLTPFWSAVWERGQRSYLQAGQYEYTADHRPLIGPVGSLGPDGLALNGGYSGHGVMASAGGGRLLVDLLLGRVTGANPFRVDRPMPERSHDVL